MIRFYEQAQKHMQWGSKLTKKLYNDVMNDDEDEEIFIRISEFDYIRVMFNSTNSVIVRDPASYLNGCTISGVIEIYGTPIGNPNVDYIVFEEP